MKSGRELESILRRIDGRGYRAYKDIAGGYSFEDIEIFIDYVQGDPFAAPTRLRVRQDQSEARIPTELFASKVRKVALEDFLARQVSNAIGGIQRRRGTGKSGLIAIDAGGQEVLERTALEINEDWVEARLEVGLPASGRRVLGREAESLLCDDLIDLMDDSLGNFKVFEDDAREFVECVENQESIREQLRSRALVAFVANGSILPRQSGVSDLPMAGERVTPFASPSSLLCAFDLPNGVLWGGEAVTHISGMGLPHGITLIAGGGYHGKSTLLRAIERSVYPHVPGDGREYVVTDGDAVKVRAEDRRRVTGVGISVFINGLPDGASTTAFHTEEASGSTSQAAGIVEAIESGSSALLMDEDTSATNLLIRDARMQSLVAREMEPITPLVDRIQRLRDDRRVSTILVMGGCGDYFEIADTVLVLDRYLPSDGTDKAREVANRFPTRRSAEAGEEISWVSERFPIAKSINAVRNRGRVKIDAPAMDSIRFGFETIDLRAVEQIVDRSQTRAIGYALHLAADNLIRSGSTLPEILDLLESEFERGGLEVLARPSRSHEPGNCPHPGNFARPRRHEIAAALNRLRTLEVEVKGERESI